MPLDPSAQHFLKLLAALNPPSALSLSVMERRIAFAHLMSFGFVPPAAALVAEGAIPGPTGPLAVRTYTPDNSPKGLLPGLIYFHGGGLIAGNLDTHDGICRVLAISSRCRVLSVDYRLAPEHRFPAALQDGCSAVRYIGEHAQDFAIDVRRLGICGDSAGATLAAAICQQLAESGHTGLAFQLLLCPITDQAGRSPSRRELSQGYLLDEATLEHDLRNYVNSDVLPNDPRVSPLHATDLARLPPTSIHTAEYDLLRDEGRAYADRLQQAGISTRYTCHPGMIHLFYAMGGIIPYAEKAWNAIGAEIRAQFSMT